MTRAEPISGSILAADIERFGDPHRDDVSGIRITETFYRLLREAFAAASVPWEQCAPEDRGDGAVIFVPARLATVLLIDPLLGWLSTALDRHNQASNLAGRFRLRLALHRGDVLPTEHGHTGSAVVLACRLLDAPALRTAIRHAAGSLAVIVSDTVYDTVVRHGFRTIDPARYHPVPVTVKRTRATAWIHLPGDTRPPVTEDDQEPTTPSPAPVPGTITITGTATGTRSTGVRIGKLQSN
jgi:hypothetical protein